MRIEFDAARTQDHFELRRQVRPGINAIALASLQPAASARAIADIDVNRTGSRIALENARHLLDGIRVVDAEVQRYLEPLGQLLLRLRHAQNPAEHKARFFSGPLNGPLDDADSVFLKFILATHEI